MGMVGLLKVGKQATAKNIEKTLKHLKRLKKSSRVNKERIQALIERVQ
jgi:hypothetical protein